MTGRNWTDPLPKFDKLMSRTIVTGYPTLKDSEIWWMHCAFVPPGQGYCLAPKAQLFAIGILRYAISAVSILVTSLGAFIVVRSKTISREYRAMLVITLVIWMSVDVNIQLLGDPFLLFPTMCVYHRAELTSSQMTALAGFSIVQSLVMFGVVTYFALFIYRHQKIAPPGSPFKFSMNARIVFLFALLFPYLGIGPLFYRECTPIADTLRRFETNQWAGSNRERIDLFQLNIINNSLLIFNGLFALLFMFLTAQQTFAQIRDAKNISPTMQRLHRLLTRSLIFQALTPLFFIIIPISIATITMYILTRPEAELSIKPVHPFIIALVLFSCHATAHAAVLIGTTPAFRAKLLQMMSCLIPRRIATQQHPNFAVRSEFLSFTRTTTQQS